MKTTRILLVGMLTLSAAWASPAGAGPLDSDAPVGWNSGTTPPAPANATFMIHFSADALKRAVADSREECEPVRDRILDADVFGTACTKASVDAELVHDNCNLSLDLVVRGVVWSRTVGYQQPVKVYTLGTMPFTVHKRIGINARGVFGAFPRAEVTSATKLQRMTDMEDQTEFGFEDVARYTFYESLPGATLEVEAKGRAKLEARVEKDSVPKLHDAQRAYVAAKDWAAKTLKRRPDKLHFYSTATHANLALQTTSDKESAPIPAPPSLPGPWDVGFRLHESVVNGVAQDVLAGKTFTLDEIGNLGETLVEWLRTQGKGKLPAKTDPGSNAETGVSITFARKDPIQVVFADQLVKVIIHGENYRVADDDYQGFRAVVAYRIVSKGGEIVATREGTPQVEPAGVPTGKQKKLPKAEQAFLRQAIENFSERLLLPAIPLPPPLDRFGTLLPRIAEARNSWLVVAWQLKS